MTPLLRKAHNTDPSTTKIINYLRAERCLHCKQRYELGRVIIYTQLSNGKLIWYHGRKYNDDDDPCYITKNVQNVEDTLT